MLMQIYEIENHRSVFLKYRIKAPENITLSGAIFSHWSIGLILCKNPR